MARVQTLFSNPVLTGDRVNCEGYPAFSRSWQEQYVQLLLTNTMSNTFYMDETSLMLHSQELHEAALNEDVCFAAKAMIYARNQGFMRLQPIFGLSLLSNGYPNLFKRVFPYIIQTPADLSDFLYILSSAKRGQGGRAVKTMAAQYLNRLSEYHAIKYKGKGLAFPLADMLRTIHPKPVNNKQSALFAYLRAKGTPDLSELPQVAAVRQLHTAHSEAEQIAAIAAGRLPHNLVTGAVKMTPAIWEALLPDMPLFALLRHLATLERNNIVDNHRELIENRLADETSLRRAKILPFRLAQAYQSINNAWIKDALRNAVEKSIVNLPELEGSVAILLDISGSMEGQYLVSGALFALGLYKQSGGKAKFLLFDTAVYDPQPSLCDSILTQAERIKSGGGTDTGVALKYLRQQKWNIDTIVLITDEQQNSGSPFYKELTSYRKTVNRYAKAVIIDLTPYDAAMTPPDDEQTYYCYGWSDAALTFTANVTRGYGSLIEEIHAIQLETNE